MTKDPRMTDVPNNREPLQDRHLNTQKKQKKPFLPPRVTKHGSLPKVTGQSFVGTFSP